MSDKNICTPVLKQAELHAKSANVYLYQFSYKGWLGGSMYLANITGEMKLYLIASNEY